MTIWTYTNNDDGPRWSADGVAVDLLTDGTFRVEGLTECYETLREAKERALRWRDALANALEEKGHAERTWGTEIFQTPWLDIKLHDLPPTFPDPPSSLQCMLNDPLAVVHFPELPPAYPEAEWHGGR